MLWAICLVQEFFLTCCTCAWHLLSPSLRYSLCTLLRCVTTPCPMKASSKNSFAVNRRPITRNILVARNQASVHLGFAMQVNRSASLCTEKKRNRFCLLRNDSTLLVSMAVMASLHHFFVYGLLLNASSDHFIFNCLFLCTPLPYCLAFRVTEHQLVCAKIPRSKVFKKYLQNKNRVSQVIFPFHTRKFASVPTSPVFHSLLCSVKPTIVSIPRPRSQGRNSLRRLEAPQCTTSSTCLSSRPTPAPPLSISRLSTAARLPKRTARARTGRDGASRGWCRRGARGATCGGTLITLSFPAAPSYRR